MTSSANDEWKRYELIMAIHIMEGYIMQLQRSSRFPNAHALDIESLKHVVGFIKYNMDQSEIIGGNGD